MAEKVRHLSPDPGLIPRSRLIEEQSDSCKLFSDLYDVLNYAHLPTCTKKSIKIRQMEKKSQNLSNSKKAGHASNPSIWEAEVGGL